MQGTPDWCSGLQDVQAGDRCRTYMQVAAPNCNAGTLKEVACAGVRGTDAAAAAVIRAAARNNSLHLMDLRGVALGPEVGTFRSLGGGREM